MERKHTETADGCEFMLSPSLLQLVHELIITFEQFLTLLYNCELHIERLYIVRRADDEGK